jgi:5-methylcytosine-specific restriction protein B
MNGQLLELEAQQVEADMHGVDPETVRLHAVEVGGRLYPVKQVLARATGLDRLDFTSAQARSILKRLGFRLHRMGS